MRIDINFLSSAQNAKYKTISNPLEKEKGLTWPNRPNGLPQPKQGGVTRDRRPAQPHVLANLQKAPE